VSFIRSVPERHESSLETKIGLSMKEIDSAERVTNAALNDEAYRAAAQKEIELRKTLENLLRKSLSRARNFVFGENPCCNVKFGTILMMNAGSFSEDDTQEFWNALPKAKISQDKRILSLVNRTFFLGNMDYGDKLLIRNCYGGIWARVERHFQEGGRGVVVIGNPGM
jgi:hypothetical protein